MHVKLSSRIFLYLLPLIYSVGASASVKSFREWKSDQIQSAQGRVNSTRGQIDTKRNRGSTASKVDPNLNNKMTVEGTVSIDNQIDKLERQLKLEQYDLENAKDLTVTDYFVGYLIKMRDKKSAFSEVAGKLSAEEVAEIMNAYANSVFGIQSSDLPVSATNLSKDGIK